MPHREGRVGFTVENASQRRNGASRDDLTNKNDAAPPAFRRPVPNVKAEVYFFKIAMERKGDPADSSLEKQKTDDAHVRSRFIFIELEAWRNQWLDYASFDWIIEHHQIPPFGSEKGLSA